MEDWEYDSIWGEPSEAGLKFNKELFDSIVKGNKVQKTENSKKRLEFLEDWKEENLSRIREWQSLNRKLYLESLFE